MILPVLLWTTFLTLLPAAQASYWKFSASTSTGTRTAKVNGVDQTEDAWTAPTADSTNGITVSVPAVTVTSNGGMTSAECHATLNLHVTATWVADPAGDPAPTSVWFIENSSASWSGNGVVPVNSPPTGPPTPVGQSGPGPAARMRVCSYGRQPRPAYVRFQAASPSPSDYLKGSADDGIDGACTGVGGCTSQTDTSSTAKPPPGWHKKPVSGGTASFDYTLKADATADFSASGGGFCTSLTASVGSYSVSIHPQPYNYHDTGYNDGNGVHHSGPEIDDVGGHLIYHYKWSSTDGDITHLTSCQVGEYLDYSGNTDGSYDTIDGVNVWIYPSPPVGPDPDTGKPQAERNPDRKYQAATLGGIGDDLKPPASWIQTYKGVTWTVNQKYCYNDTATGEVDVIVPGPDAGPFSIVRTVYKRSTQTWRYTVTKGGQMAYCTLP